MAREMSAAAREQEGRSEVGWSGVGRVMLWDHWNVTCVLTVHCPLLDAHAHCSLPVPPLAACEQVNWHSLMGTALFSERLFTTLVVGE